jgi:sterol desaturase/sphingolipid hydroxylase (fatty acid hydroxylase superfamily)
MDLLNHELPLRFLFFGLTFLILALWEQKNQAIPLTQNKKNRWLNHLGLSFLGVVLVRTFVPWVGVSIAWFALYHRLGLFNQIALPDPVIWVLSVLNLDWALYYQHRALHALPPLWKCHRVHHTDLDFDVSTGFRFHFLETGFTLLIKALVILVLGCPPTAVLAFEVIYMMAVLFNHSNIKLRPGIEKSLRSFIVTPDMHRIHHSSARQETNSNFTFIFSWWDRAFGTYRAQPAAGYEKMTLGLENFRDPVDSQLPNLLLQPFMDAGQNISMKNFESKETAYTQGK